MQRGIGGRVLGPHSCQQQQARPAMETQKVVQPFQRIPIRPLQIVHEEQQWISGAQQRPRRCLKQILALPAIGGCTWLGQVGLQHQQLRQQTRHLTQPDRFQTRQPFVDER